MSQYNFKTYSNNELITFALDLPADLEATERNKLIRELSLRLRRLQDCVNRF